MVPALNRLIITADDFGLAPEVNQAVEIAHRGGILTAASLMVAGPAAKGAIDRARRLPGLRVGLHLVLVDGRPVLPPEKIPDLVDGNGYLRSNMLRLAFEIALRPPVREQVCAEIAAQFEAFHATGLQLDHVNAHKHFHLHPIIAAKVISIGMRYGMRALRVPVEPRAILRKADGGWLLHPSQLNFPWERWLQLQARRAHLIMPDAVFGLRWSGAMTAKRLAGLITNLPSGIVEIYTHPATNEFAGHAPGYAYAEELAALMSRSVRDALQRSGHCLGGYSDIRPDEIYTSPAASYPLKSASHG